MKVRNIVAIALVILFGAFSIACSGGALDEDTSKVVVYCGTHENPYVCVSEEVPSSPTVVNTATAAEADDNQPTPTPVVITKTETVEVPVEKEVEKVVYKDYPNRENCDDIRGGNYLSHVERFWFLAFCANPTVSAAAAQAPVPQAQPAPAPEPAVPAADSASSGDIDYCYNEYPSIPMGVQTFIRAGCNIIGDVQLCDPGCHRIYDDDPSTGKYTPCPAGCTVIADYSSNATSRSLASMNQDGCGGGCRFTIDQQVPAEAQAPQPSASGCTQDGVQIPAGAFAFEVGASCSVMGDVEVNDSLSAHGRVLYKGDGNGVLLTCIQTCWVRADWGATISDAPADRLEAEMRDHGCADQKGCAQVYRYTSP